MWSINGINYTLTQNQRNQVLLDSCTQLGFDVPRFCYHENLRIAGNCRMCSIEDSKAPKPVICCAGNAAPDLNIFTNTIQVKKSRESVMEFLSINHPLDCPICDQGGECDLQDLALVYGSDHGRFYEYKRNVEDKSCGPIVKTVMNRCILCTRCVRFATDIAGFTSFGLTGRGGKMEIGSYVEKILDSELSGNIVDVCPVGALTSKPYAFNSRPWELKKVSLFSVLDDQPQLIRADIKENEIVRLSPSKNANGKNLWLTNRSRFSYEGLTRNRIIEPEIYGIKTSWLILLTLLKKFCNVIAPNFWHQNIINFDLQDPSSLRHFDLLTLRTFLTTLGSTGKVIVSDNIFKKNFTFLPRVSETIIRENICFTLLSVNLSFELPITALLIMQRLNDLNGAGLLITWRSVVTPTLLSFTTNLNTAFNDLINLVLAKTWLNLLIVPKTIVYFYGINYQLLVQLLYRVLAIQKFLVASTSVIRNVIDIDLSSVTDVGHFNAALVDYTIGVDSSPRICQHSFISLVHSTHFSQHLAMKLITSFTAPNKAYVESLNYNYNLDYSYFKSFRALSAPVDAKTVDNLLKVLTQFFNINISASYVSSITPLVNVLTPFLNVKEIPLFCLSYLLKNIVYEKKPLSRTAYYRYNSLLRAAPTLNAIQLNSFNNNIY